MKSIVFVFFFFKLTFLSAAQINQVDDLRQKYFSLIKPHALSSKVQFLKINDKITIAYKVYKVKNEKASIVISSGRTEGLVKYEELIYDLTRNGYSVYIFDHRGQGYSSRQTSDSQLGYIKDFYSYVRDMNLFVKKVVKYDKKLFLLAHSMGGTIASLYIEEYQDTFDAVVLSSPMHQLNLLTSGITSLLCKVIQKYVPKVPRYIIGGKSFDESEHIFSKNALTHSKLRFEIVNMSYEFHPKAKLGAPSVSWVSQACQISPILISQAYKVKTPTLVLQAGGDTIVNLQAQEDFCHNVGDKCKLITIDGAYHELFIEEDRYRNKALSAMYRFFDDNR